MANTNDPAEFWRDYEAKIGEKIVRYGLGRYLSGWDEFKSDLWGLVIVTEGGFRFHHFPHEGWLGALTRVGGGGGSTPTEKTLHIPKSSFISIELKKEKSLLKRILAPMMPTILVRYRKVDGNDGTLVFELDREPEAFAAALQEQVPVA
jgi:hypothetical protein